MDDPRIPVVAKAMFTSPYLYAYDDEWDDPRWEWERGKCMEAAVGVLDALDAMREDQP